MKLLFEIDLKNYDLNGTKFIRPSVRAVIVKDGRLAMVHSLKYDYYKFPGRSHLRHCQRGERGDRA